MTEVATSTAVVTLSLGVWHIVGLIMAVAAGAFTALARRFKKGPWNPTKNHDDDINLPVMPVDPQEPVAEPVAPPVGPHLDLYYEAKPFKVTQKWGIYDPATYRRFGYDRHSGVDIAHGTNARVRAPFDYEIYRTLWQPNGGGRVLTIVSKQAYEGPGGAPLHVMADYLHLASYVRTEGEGKTGDLLCLAGNSGFSTGPHTHISYRWVRQHGADWQDVEKNDANNTFNQMPFYNGKYAVDAVQGA